MDAYNLLLAVHYIVLDPSFSHKKVAMGIL